MNELTKKAIEISINHHFCDMVDEMEIYDALSDSDNDDQPYLIWEPFANMSNSDLRDSVESLKNDIIRTFEQLLNAKDGGILNLTLREK